MALALCRWSSYHVLATTTGCLSARGRYFQKFEKALHVQIDASARQVDKALYRPVDPTVISDPGAVEAVEPSAKVTESASACSYFSS